MAAGILAVGDIDQCKVVFMKDAIYFLSKKLDPQALSSDPITNIIRLIELSDLEIFVHDKALKKAGMIESDLTPIENLKVVSTEKISQLLLEADMSFKY